MREARSPILGMTLAEQSFLVLFVLLIFIAGLLELTNRSESEIASLENEITKLRDRIKKDRIELTRLKNENVHLGDELRKARGKPSCWVSPSDSVEFLFRVTIIKADSLIVESAAPIYRADEYEKLVGNMKLGSMNQDEFAKIGRSIKRISDSKDCIFYVLVHRDPSIEARQIELIEKWFYKKISNLRGRNLNALEEN